MLTILSHSCTAGKRHDLGLHGEDASLRRPQDHHRGRPPLRGRPRGARHACRDRGGAGSGQIRTDRAVFRLCTAQTRLSTSKKKHAYIANHIYIVLFFFDGNISPIFCPRPPESGIRLGNHSKPTQKCPPWPHDTMPVQGGPRRFHPGWMPHPHVLAPTAGRRQQTL